MSEVQWECHTQTGCQLNLMFSTTSPHSWLVEKHQVELLKHAADDWEERGKKPCHCLDPERRPFSVKNQQLYGMQEEKDALKKRCKRHNVFKKGGHVQDFLAKCFEAAVNHKDTWYLVEGEWPLREKCYPECLYLPFFKRSDTWK